MRPLSYGSRLDTRELFKFFAVLALGLVILSGCFVACTAYAYRQQICEQPGACGDQIPFVSAEWKTGGTISDPVRLRMVDDLRSNVALNGLTEAEVIELLGPASTSGYFQEMCEYVYWLGPERGLFGGIDAEWLCLHAQNGVVTSHEILRD